MSGKEQPHRARTVDELRALQADAFLDDEEARSIASFKPRPSDIVISPFSKCGTTWLQQAFHCLRTRGDEDFDEISRVVPWIESAISVGLDLEAPQKGSPRGFKSHLSYDAIPKGARYVVSFRDPNDAMVSLFRFFEGWFIEPGTISIGDFARFRIANDRGSGYWPHLLSWWAQRDNPNVLLLSYEDMSANPEANIRRLARFCGIALDDALLALTLERSSLAYMLAHKDKFDERLTRDMTERRGIVPKGSDAAKVRKGVVGTHLRELPEDVAAALDTQWKGTVTAQLGFESYAAFEAALRRYRPRHDRGL